MNLLAPRFCRTRDAPAVPLERLFLSSPSAPGGLVDLDGFGWREVEHVLASALFSPADLRHHQGVEIIEAEAHAVGLIDQGLDLAERGS